MKKTVVVGFIPKSCTLHIHFLMISTSLVTSHTNLKLYGFEVNYVPAISKYVRKTQSRASLQWRRQWWWDSYLNHVHSVYVLMIFSLFMTSHKNLKPFCKTRQVQGRNCPDLSTNMASEVISEHLLLNKFGGEHAPTPLACAYSYICTIISAPPTLSTFRHLC